MANTMNLRVNSRNYQNVSIEDVRVIEMILSKYNYTDDKPKAETPKVESKPKAKADKPKQYAKVYTVGEDGKSVTIGNDGFIPTKVFKGVTYSLKQANAKYDSKTKAWVFDTKTACKNWCKAQDARG